MQNLCINLISRGRPTRLLDTINRTLSNIVNPNTVLMVSVDLDDPMTIDMLAASPAADKIKVTFAEREDTLGAKYNRALQIPADIYMPMVDHTVPVTKGFDQLILDAASLFPDGIGAVHTQMANASFAAYNALTAKWVEITGGIYPTYFPYWFVDHWTDDLARMIGRISYADVQCDLGQKPPTSEMREPGWWATWYDAVVSLRRMQAMMMISQLDEKPETKKRLENNMPLVEYRSRWINDSVRAQSGQLAVMSGNLSTADDRYQRVRQHAVDLLPGLLNVLPPTVALQYRNMLIPPTSVPALQRVG